MVNTFNGEFDELQQYVKQISVPGEWEERLDNCKRYNAHNGAILNWWPSTGRLQFQGNAEARLDMNSKLSELIGQSDTRRSSTPNCSEINRKIFVVYGHDKNARNELEAMLLRWKLEPLILENLTSGGQTIIEKLEKHSGEAGFAVVLATPDDEGYPLNCPKQKKKRARQNVVLELGMLLSKLGREKVAILIKDEEKMEKPSDINGIIYFKFKDSIQEVQVGLALEMNDQGYDIVLKNL